MLLLLKEEDNAHKFWYVNKKRWNSLVSASAYWYPAVARLRCVSSRESYILSSERVKLLLKNAIFYSAKLQYCRFCLISCFLFKVNVT